jgi:site-specific recombinase XerD
MKGVPIESISKMLGHSRIIMTQHYSKVVDLKIERDSELLFKEELPRLHP